MWGLEVNNDEIVLQFLINVAAFLTSPLRWISKLRVAADLMQLHREPTQPHGRKGFPGPKAWFLAVFCINGLTFAAIENGYYCNVKF